MAMEMRRQEIWPKATGILDLPDDWPLLALSEIARIKRTWAEHSVRLLGSPELADFTEKLNREWAIETGQLENLYEFERGITETLINSGFRASVLKEAGEEKNADQILALIQDQKDALEGLFAFVKQDRPLSTSYIKELHQAMTRSQTTIEARDIHGNLGEVEMIHGDWKKHPNYPLRDGTIFEYCPPEHTASEMDKLVSMHLGHLEQGVLPEVEAAWLHHRFTQIHPFQDGNGRVARALASLVLIRAGLFPLMIRLSDKDAYITALERADKGNLRPIVSLFGRKVQGEFRKANSLALKFAPPSATVEEAANSLAESIIHHDAARVSRLQHRIDQVANTVHSTLNQASVTAIGLLRRADPEANIQVIFRAYADADEFKSRARAITERYDVTPELPAVRLKLQIAAGSTYDVFIYTYTIADDLEGSVHTSAFFREHLVDTPSLESGQGDESPTLQDRADIWSKELLAHVLDTIRRGF